MRNDPEATIAHLLRRAGFGATPAELQKYVALGYDGAARSLVAGGPDAAPAPTLDIVNQGEIETVEERKARAKQRQMQRRQIANWWLERMTVAEQPLAEKMTWYWHGHFATSIDKVNEAKFMLQQNETFRGLGMGKFEALTQAVAKDPAMMLWLDSNANKKGSPNENFGRELMELFTVGIGTYSEADVKEAARTFTGWRVARRTGVFSLQGGQVDRGPKSVLGRAVTTGEELISILASHPAAAKFVTAKLWFKFAAPTTVDSPVVADLAAVFTSSGGDIKQVMQALFLHPEFLSPAVRQGLVKQPVEYVVGALRASGLRPSDTDVTGPDLLNALRNLNQLPFDPPSVGGWPGNGYWISTATALERLRFANALSGSARLDWLTGAGAADRPTVLARQLGVDEWSSATMQALRKVSAPKQQFALALTSPEFVLN